MDKSKQTILSEEMDILYEKFLNCRAYFPYMTEKDIGKTEFDTSPMYFDLGYHITFKLEEPLTIENINKNNELSHWLNQNFIVRLFSLMENICYKPEIDKHIEGWEEVDIVRRLRHKFGHTSGYYNSDNKEERKLVEVIVEHFNLDIENPEEIPLPIDTVIKPIFDKCKIYLKGKN